MCIDGIMTPFLNLENFGNFGDGFWWIIGVLIGGFTAFFVYQTYKAQKDEIKRLKKEATENQIQSVLMDILLPSLRISLEQCYNLFADLDGRFGYVRFYEYIDSQKIVWENNINRKIAMQNTYTLILRVEYYIQKCTDNKEAISSYQAVLYSHISADRIDKLRLVIESSNHSKDPL